jgi:hypothetical protein
MYLGTVRRFFAIGSVLSAIMFAGVVHAQGTAAPAERTDLTLGGSTSSPSASASGSASASATPPEADTMLPEAPPEAPPPLPHHKGIVLDASLGMLNFVGEFRHVAPTAFWLHTQLGYELFESLMLFGEGEMAFTDTSEAQDETKSHVFPIFGFGGGARFTIHFTDRVAMFVQGQLGAMKADIGVNELGTLGFKSAEALGLYFGARLGVEWYQIDRHFALALEGGARDALGFKKQIGGADTPIMWDLGPALRYTF